MWAYEKPEPSPETAYTNNDKNPYETPSPDIKHFSSSDIELKTNKTVENNEYGENDTYNDGSPKSQSVHHQYEAADTQPDDPSP